MTKHSKSQDKSPYTKEEVKSRLESELKRNSANWYNKAAVSVKVGCSPTTIFRWFDGCLPKDPAQADKCCQLYGIDMLYWFTGRRSEGGGIDTLDLDPIHFKKAMQATEIKGQDQMTFEQRATLIKNVYELSSESPFVLDTLRLAEALQDFHDIDGPKISESHRARIIFGFLYMPS